MPPPPPGANEPGAIPREPMRRGSHRRAPTVHTALKTDSLALNHDKGANRERSRSPVAMPPTMQNARASLRAARARRRNGGLKRGHEGVGGETAWQARVAVTRVDWPYT